MPNFSTNRLRCRAIGCALLSLVVSCGVVSWGLASVATAQTQTTTARTTTTTTAAAQPTYVAPVAPPNAATNAPSAPPPSREAPPPESEESKLPDLIYIQPFVGAGYVNLKSFSSDDFDIENTDSVDDVVVTSKGSGLRYGVAGGFNIIFIHLGGRLAFTQTSAFTLGTAQFEAAIAPKIGPFEPSFRVGIGYAWQGAANYGNYQDQTDVYGLALGAGIGLDVRLGQVVGLGIAFDGDLLNMSRSTNLGDVTTIKAESGSAVGFQGAFTGHITVHI